MMNDVLSSIQAGEYETNIPAINPNQEHPPRVYELLEELRELHLEDSHRLWEQFKHDMLSQAGLLDHPKVEEIWDFLLHNTSGVLDDVDRKVEMYYLLEQLKDILG